MQVPLSTVLQREPEIKWTDVEMASEPLAVGGFAEVYSGTYKAKPAAIKIWRVSQQDVPVFS